MAVLAIVGAVMTSCSSDNKNEVVTPPQPVNTDKVVTLKATVSMDNGIAGTRALDADGHKTFDVGDKIAVVYKNTSGSTVKAVSEALISEDIASGSKSADFTVTLTNPDKTKNVTYIYPAAMAKDDGSVNYDALSEQNGTLATLESNLDYCQYTGAWSGDDLPNGDLANQLAICVFTLKNALGSSEITSSITSLVLTEGSNIYTVSRSAAAGPIYVAIRPTSDKTINFLAGAGTTTTYAKYVQNKTYEAGKMYKIGLKMAEVIGGIFSVSSTNKVYFSKGNLQATTSNNGGKWSWHFGPNQYARVGNGTANTKITGNGTVSSDGNGKNVDLFGWSTSATHLGISNNTDNSTYGTTFVDWGSASEVTACIGTGWRTLNKNEWRYLMENRGDNCFAMAKLWNNRCGMILLPDNWDNTGDYKLNNTNNGADKFTNIITEAKWSTLEAKGAVFLPVTGQRNSGTTVNGDDDQLHYWSSSNYNSTTALHMRCMPNAESPNTGLAPDAGAGKSNGFSVRLVYPIK